MQINVMEVLKDLDGVDIQDRDSKGQPIPLTVKKVLTTSLITITQGQHINADQKYKQYKLATRMSNATGIVDITSDEIPLLKVLIGLFWPPVVYGRCVDFLDAASAPAV